MRVALLGPGRLGRTLAILLPAAGVEAVPWARGEPIPRADVYWLTVRDTAIAEVARLLPVDAIALHASGARGPEALGERAERGLLHPLMTFPGPEVGIPSLVGVGARIAGSAAAVASAQAIARALGLVPFTLDGDPRAYHAAATVASNHLAALFLQSVEILTRAGLPAAEARQHLLPLAIESVRRVADAGALAITGPAARDDVATEAAHRAVLFPSEILLYDRMSEAIRALRAADAAPDLESRSASGALDE